MGKNVPKHIAIIMDGNRRWAKKRNLAGFEGHRQGTETTENLHERAKSEISASKQMVLTFRKKKLNLISLSIMAEREEFWQVN